MKITIIVGKIHLLKFLFVVVASKNSSEENLLGMMSQLNLNKSNMNDYLKMSIEDLEELKKNLLNQKSNLNNTIEEVVNNIRFKKTLSRDKVLRLNPYYKDKSSYLKVIINDEGGYIVTKVTPSLEYLGICQFLSKNIEFLKYYEMCSKSDWENALNRLNMCFKDAGLKVKEL